MERLTGYDENGCVFSCEEERLLSASGVISKDDMYKIMMHLAEKLAEYEDLEEQCIKENSWCLKMLMEKWREFLEDIQELYEYRKAEEQGELLKLPCAVGDIIYVTDRGGQPREMIMDSPDIRCHCANENNFCMVLCDRKNTGICAYRFRTDGSDIGTRVFLTKSEAERALKETEGESV